MLNVSNLAMKVFMYCTTCVYNYTVMARFFYELVFA